VNRSSTKEIGCLLLAIERCAVNDQRGQLLWFS
jgi:hypothetical protein